MVKVTQGSKYESIETGEVAKVCNFAHYKGGLLVLYKGYIRAGSNKEARVLKAVDFNEFCLEFKGGTK